MLYIAGGLAVILIVTAFHRVDMGSPAYRYHQHQERPGEAELGTCNVCGGGEFHTHLPIISIDTGGQKMPGRPITFGREREFGRTSFYELLSDLIDQHDSELLGTVIGDFVEENAWRLEDRFVDYEDLLSELIELVTDVFGSALEDDHDSELGEEFISFSHRLHQTSDNGESEILVSLHTVDNTNAWNHIGDTPIHTAQALARYRGNSSRWFDKPNYRIRLRRDNDTERERSLPLLGMAAGSTWSLHGPFLDKTLMRNYVWMNISSEVIAGYVPNVRFCELIVDGEYQGVYLLMEMVTVQNGRVDIRRYRDGDPVLSYLLLLDKPNPMRRIHNFSAYTRRHEPYRYMELRYPGLSNQNDYVRNYVTAEVSEIEKSLYSLDTIWHTGSYEKYLNVDSFVDFYIMKEFLVDNDTFSVSTFFYKDVRGKFTIGPIWDLNNMLDNLMRSFPYNEFILNDRGWYSALMKDEKFTERVISRWRYLRSGVLSEERLIEYHTEVELWLGSAIVRNYEVWGYSFDPGLLSSRTRRRPNASQMEAGLTIYDMNPSSYAEAMDWMLEYMIDRGRYMDNHIEMLRQYSHPSRHAVLALD